MPVRESASTRNTFASTPSSLRRLRSWGLLPAAAAVLAASLVAGCSKTDDSESSIVRTTTVIAGAGVVGIDRDTTQACGLPSAVDAGAGATRSIAHAAGVSEVPTDPKRIVVLSTAALDATCALGLWERVVGAATVSGPTPQPAYLGSGISAIPGVGAVGSIDTAKIAALKPDVIIGAAADGPQYDALKAIAPTVLVASDAGWQEQFGAIGEALGRHTAAEKDLDDYRTAARDAGAAVNSGLTQASVIRFGAKDIQVQGGNSFAGQVLGDTGVQRPQPQRGNSFDLTSLSAQEDRIKVEGDIIYVMFDGADGLSYGKSVMNGDDWKKLGAVSDRREFAVDDSIWHGSGVTAARALVYDISKSLNNYVAD